MISREQPYLLGLRNMSTVFNRILPTTLIDKSNFFHSTILLKTVNFQTVYAASLSNNENIKRKTKLECNKIPQTAVMFGKI